MHDISESASDNETERPKHISISNSSVAPKLRPKVSNSVERNTSTPLLLNGSRHSSFDESDNVKFHGASFNTLERGRERERTSPFKDQYDQGYRKPPTGPQKPARSLDRRKTFSRCIVLPIFQQRIYTNFRLNYSENVIEFKTVQELKEIQVNKANGLWSIFMRRQLVPFRNHILTILDVPFPGKN